MRRLPSRYRRLDDALAALPVEAPMLLSELDGFLTGILVGPDPVPPEEWLQSVWGPEDAEVPVFEDPADVRWFADAVMARLDEIARDLGRGKPRPLLDVDERNGDLLWEPWIDGFAEAMALRPESWAAVAAGTDAEAAGALARLTLLIAVARDESELDSIEINALQDRAPAELVDDLRRLHAARQRAGAALPAATIAAPAVAVGRNEPCPCGSGRKSKRCCAGSPASVA